MNRLIVTDALATDVVVDDSKEAQVDELGESIPREADTNYGPHLARGSTSIGDLVVSSWLYPVSRLIGT
jgi:hypothetical protein